MHSYLVRLLLLSSASFLVVQLFLAGLIVLVAPAAIRRAAGMAPDRAARLLLTMRLLPTALAALIVAALCVPSYLKFEPAVAAEEVGAVCLIAAILGALFCAVSIYRAISALIRSSLQLRRFGGRELHIGEETVWVVPQNAGAFLAGLVHPRMLISESAIRELSADQLAVTLRHEQAHRSSADNWKRLLILLAPAVFPGLRALERAWDRCAEWAADDRAAGGNENRSVTLAEALIRVARLQSSIATPPLATSLIESQDDLALRVDRLLRRETFEESRHPEGMLAMLTAGLLIAAVALNPAALRVVHLLLERLLD